MGIVGHRANHRYVHEWNNEIQTAATIHRMYRVHTVCWCVCVGAPTCPLRRAKSQDSPDQASQSQQSYVCMVCKIQ